MAENQEFLEIVHGLSVTAAETIMAIRKVTDGLTDDQQVPVPAPVLQAWVLLLESQQQMIKRLVEENESARDRLEALVRRHERKGL